MLREYAFYEVEQVSLGLMGSKDIQDFWQAFKDTNDFNHQAFNQLYEDTNDDTVLRILARFNETLLDSIDKMSTAIQKEDCEAIWRISHKIAGSAELLGFEPFGNRSRELNFQVKANPDMPSHIEEIESYLRYTRELVERIKTCCPNLNSYL